MEDLSASHLMARRFEDWPFSLFEHDRNARLGFSQTRSEAVTGCLERLSSKAAASEEAKRTLCSTLRL